MDAAALSLTIESSSVVTATGDLERFAKAADKARAAAGGSNTNGAARMAQDYARAAEKAGQFSSAASRAANDAQRVAAANDNLALSAKSAAAAISASSTSIGQADAHIQAYRSHLAQIPAAAAAASAGVATSAGAMKANTGNIAAQFQDIGVTALSGMSPMLIALQQGTQLSAVFAQSGGSALATIRAAFMSILSPTALLTIALVAGAAMLIQWAMSALSASGEADKLSKAIEQTKLTSYALGDAQSALGLVIDLTTGKIKSQSEALRGLARAQLEVIRVTAIRDQAEARKTIAEQRGLNTPTAGSAPSVGVMGMSVTSLSGRTSASESQRVLDQFSSGKLTPTQAIDGMQRLRDAGKLTEEQFIKTAGAIANFGVAGENLKVYADARKALDGDQKALQQFLTPSASRRGGASDADRLSSIVQAAGAEVTAQENRLKAVGMSARAAAEMEQRTKLLNQLQQAGIPITAKLALNIEKLATSYADTKIAADTAEAIQGVSDAIATQIDAVNDDSSLLGLYGDALIRARNETEALARARAALPKGVVLSEAAATALALEAGLLSDDQIRQGQVRRAEDLRKTSEDAVYAMDLERAGLSLTGEAALKYAFVTEQLNKAKRDGTTLTPEYVASIEAAGDAYAHTRYAIDQQRQALADAREVTKGFFADWITGVREGENIFRSFADSVVKALNRIIDKLLDKALNDGLDKLFSGGGGGSGLLGSLMSIFGGSGGGSGAHSLGGSAAFGFANGGAFDRVQRFANGGAFTNQIVNSPTLFRFANGGALGEMGEAGPEAIMPLSRGPNGKLGVQASGAGGSRKLEVNVHNHNSFAGAIGVESIAAMDRQTAEATYNQLKRDLQQLLQQLDEDGAFAT